MQGETGGGLFDVGHFTTPIWQVRHDRARSNHLNSRSYVDRIARFAEKAQLAQQGLTPGSDSDDHDRLAKERGDLVAQTNARSDDLPISRPWPCPRCRTVSGMSCTACAASRQRPARDAGSNLFAGRVLARAFAKRRFSRAGSEPPIFRPVIDLTANSVPGYRSMICSIRSLARRRSSTRSVRLALFPAAPGRHPRAGGGTPCVCHPGRRPSDSMEDRGRPEHCDQRHRSPVPNVRPAVSRRCSRRELRCPLPDGPVLEACGAIRASRKCGMRWLQAEAGFLRTVFLRLRRMPTRPLRRADSGTARNPSDARIPHAGRLAVAARRGLGQDLSGLGQGLDHGVPKACAERNSAADLEHRLDLDAEPRSARTMECGTRSSSMQFGEAGTVRAWCQGCAAGRRCRMGSPGIDTRTDGIGPHSRCGLSSPRRPAVAWTSGVHRSRVTGTVAKNPTIERMPAADPGHQGSTPSDPVGGPARS